VALLRGRFGQHANVVLSDDPAASARIAAFATGTDAWLVAVRMVSEGVDIPRLRVGVYATTTTTDLFFRQAVGRFVRWTPGVKDQKAFLFIPDDARLRSRAFQIADQRRHNLRRRQTERFDRDDAALDLGNEEQLSLFAALSAVATDHRTQSSWDADDVDDDFSLSLDDDPTLMVDLAPLPPLAGDGRTLSEMGVALGGATGRTRREEKKRLREQNAEVVVVLVRRTGRTHAQVNSELNRLSGIGRITEATVAQLRTRLDAAERWARR